MELLKKFEQQERPMGEKIKFEGVGDKYVYNITAPFEIDGANYIAARVESRQSHRQDCYDTRAVFFIKKDGYWQPDENTPTFEVEDPFLTKIKDEIIFGGTEIFDDEKNGRTYRTIFYRGTNLENLKRFSQGPSKMKDIRLIQLANGGIGVFTRPETTMENGQKIERKQIGFTVINSLKELTEENILKAKIIENQFQPEQWGGVNAPYLLGNNQIGALGHIAHFNKNGHKHYYAMTFIFDPEKHRATPLKIIATRKNFPAGPALRSDLEDVVFPGGLIKNTDGTSTLYCGLSDAEAGKITLTEVF